MILPSSFGGSTTETVGYFAYNTEMLADWIYRDIGTWEEEHWVEVRPGWSGPSDALSDLTPAPTLFRFAFVPIGGWTVLMSSGPLGSDVGILPSHAARGLGIRALRAVCTDNDIKYPARILEVFGPDGVDILGYERSIAASNDGGRWVFETYGTPYDFENLEAYKRRTRSTRFTADMMYAYLRALGVPIGVEPEWSSARMLEWRGWEEA
ncbi:MAG: hypothetical protein FWF02_07370 [Micrococcales bacterium]|nr:hypothetical protein [Micrococcales bacterium]MCL2667511.1 hypothetical protein [Micrococcales bacterium]